MRLLFTVLFSLSFFICFAQPAITGFTPTEAAPGMTMTINGSGFTTATQVRIGDSLAVFTVTSSTQITATVPVSTSGSITVVSPAGTANLGGFIYVPTSEIMTDFGGFWHAKASAPQTVLPNNSHHLLGFTHNGVTYATGVNNSRLTNNGISFVPAIFKALPVAAIAGNATGGANYIALASRVDGSATSAYVAGAANFTIKNALIDGINGLDLGTGVTNLPQTANMTFQIYNIDASKASDAEPDLILTQIADPSSSNDEFSFLDAAGNVVGNTFIQNMNHLPRLGTYTLDLFTLPVGVSYNVARPYGVASGGTNTTRPIRLVSLNLSSFGINASNAATVKALRIRPSGNSDYAFIGYNASSINLPPNAALSNETSVTRICTGGTASLEIIGTPAAGGELSYVWEESTNNGGSWHTVIEGGNYSGAGTSRLLVANAVVGRQYRATVHETGNGNAGISGVFTITAASGTPPTAVSISITGNNNTVCLNTNTTITGSITGGTNHNYQWQALTPAATYENIPGANSSIFIPPTTSTGTNTYRLFVSPGAGCPGQTSGNITVTVNGISAITVAERCGNGSVTLSATATSGTPTWFDAETGGTSVGSGNSFTTPSLTGTTTYYAAATGCAQRVPVIATIYPASAAGIITSMAGTQPQTTVLTLSSQTGNVIRWQSSTDNFNTIINNIAFTQAQMVVNNSPQPTQYRAVVQNGSCAAVNSASSAAIVTLPIRANSLKLTETGTGVQLQWETVDQTGAVAYEIEKSTDGINFAKIGTVLLQNNPLYQWLDQTPGTGTIAYRIKEVRLSGNFYYSNIATIRLHAASGLLIYPNPVKNNSLTVQLKNRAAGKYQVIVYSATGQNVYTGILNNTGGITAHNVTLPAQQTKGIYHLMLVSPDGSKEHTTILVQ